MRGAMGGSGCTGGLRSCLGVRSGALWGALERSGAPSLACFTYSPHHRISATAGFNIQRSGGMSGVVLPLPQHAVVDVPSHRNTAADKSLLNSAYDGILNAFSAVLQRAASALDASVTIASSERRPGILAQDA